MRDPQLELGAGRRAHRGIAHQSAFEDRSCRDLSSADHASIEARELRPGGPHGARMPANVRCRYAGLADAGTSAGRIRGDVPDARRAPDREPGRPAARPRSALSGKPARWFTPASAVNIALPT